LNSFGSSADGLAGIGICGSLTEHDDRLALDVGVLKSFQLYSGASTP
jgi:hypothetical protein